MLLEDVVGTSSTDVYYYHGDRLGNVRALSSSSGVVSNTYTYDAYGKTLTSTWSVYNPFKYTGEYTDSETGFVYLRARYYDPESQQFLTVDPALAWTEEAYSYAGGSPTNWVDPRGLQVGPEKESEEPEDDPLVPPISSRPVGEVGDWVDPATGNEYDSDGNLVASKPGQIGRNLENPEGVKAVGRAGADVMRAARAAEEDAELSGTCPASTPSTQGARQVDPNNPGAVLGPEGFVENPYRPGSWGKYDNPKDGTYREYFRVDIGDPDKPGFGGITQIHFYGGKTHLDPNTPFDPTAPYSK